MQRLIRIIIVALTIAAFALITASLFSLPGCRSLEVSRDSKSGDVTVRYTNFGFDTQLGNLTIDRLPDGSVSIVASDVNSQASVARAIAEGVAAGLKR